MVHDVNEHCLSFLHHSTAQSSDDPAPEELTSRNSRAKAELLISTVSKENQSCTAELVFTGNEHTNVYRNTTVTRRDNIDTDNIKVIYGHRLHRKHSSNTRNRTVNRHTKTETKNQRNCRERKNNVQKTKL